MEARDYQLNILETAKKNNTLVVIPTGLGKTLIALLLAKHYLSENPKSKVLFLAPTRPLAQQHYEYFQKNLPELYAELQLFTGKINAKKRQSLWQLADIIFSTPQCIANDLKKYRINLENVSLLIEDEAHRCLKNYDYTYVARKFLEQTKEIERRILGLTASPGSDLSVIREICKNLNIEKVEARHRESEDVKSYIQELNIEKIYVDFPEEFKKIKMPLKEIYDKKIEELKNRYLLFGPATKKAVLMLQRKLGNQLSSGNNNFNVLRGLSVCAQAIKLQHALELIETQGITQLHNYFQNLFDQAKKNQSKAVLQIVKSPQFNSAYIKLVELLGKKEHPKLYKVREIVEKAIKDNSKSKIIVFAQYRDSGILINKTLNTIPGIHAKVFVGQAKKGESGLSQKEQQEIIKEFKENEINVLTSTSIGEEGLDIPEVDYVIFYEPVPSAIRKIQRAGRTARLKPGNLIMLITKNTRDESYFWSSHYKEKKMYGALESISESLNKQAEKKQLKLDTFKK